jgi:predicted nucleic acid-binding protein
MEPMLVTSFCEFETLNAFSLGQFRGSMTEVEVERLRNNFQSDIKAGIFIPLELPQSSFIRAISLSSRITASVGVRAADLLHIAAALELGATTLYTFDQRQSKAALAVGLNVN